MTTTVESDFHRLLASEPDAMRDAVDILGRLRDDGPVHTVGKTIYLSSYEHVKLLLSDLKHFRQPVFSEYGERMSQELAASHTAEQIEAFFEVGNFEQLYMNRSGDGETHDRLRRIAHRYFTPKRMAELEGSIATYTQDMLEEVAASSNGGEFDLMPFAYRLPLMVICDMLGVPAEDREMVHSWSSRLGRNRMGREAEPLMDARGAMREFRDYIAGILARHRMDPDSVSPLVASLLDAEQGEVLSEAELTAMFVILLFAGHETTTNLLGGGLLALLTHPEEWRKIVDRPESAHEATEELLRFVSPVQWTPREAAVTFEFEGILVNEGDPLVGILATANRDPQVFHDPDKLDILRPEARQHIALGFGIHFCLGQALARLEGRIALSCMAKRFPDLELAADPRALEWQGHALLRGLKTLPVRSGLV